MRHLIPEPIQGLPQYGLGVIGIAVFSLTGGVVAMLPNYPMGVIRSVVFVSTGIVTVNLFPYQLFYTTWAYSSGDLITSTSSYLTSKALTTIKSFQMEFAGTTTGAQRNPALCQIYVCGGTGPQC